MTILKVFSWCFLLILCTVNLSTEAALVRIRNDSSMMIRAQFNVVNFLDIHHDNPIRATNMLQQSSEHKIRGVYIWPDDGQKDQKKAKNKIDFRFSKILDANNPVELIVTDNGSGGLTAAEHWL